MLRFRLLRLRLHHWCAADAGGQRQSHPHSWSRSRQRTCPYALATRGSLCAVYAPGKPRERTSVHRDEGLFVEQHVAQHASRVADLLLGTNLGCGRDILADALSCVNPYLVARSVAVVFRSVCVARSVGVADDGSPFGLLVCTRCTSQVPAHQTHAGAHVTRRAYVTRTDAVMNTWGRCTCTDVKRWPHLCTVKDAC